MSYLSEETGGAGGAGIEMQQGQESTGILLRWRTKLRTTRQPNSNISIMGGAGMEVKDRLLTKSSGVRQLATCHELPWTGLLASGVGSCHGLTAVGD